MFVNQFCPHHESRARKQTQFVCQSNNCTNSKFTYSRSKWRTDLPMMSTSHYSDLSPLLPLVHTAEPTTMRNTPLRKHTTPRSRFTQNLWRINRNLVDCHPRTVNTPEILPHTLCYSWIIDSQKLNISHCHYSSSSSLILRNHSQAMIGMMETTSWTCSF
jgi:hypothetical protein